MYPKCPRPRSRSCTATGVVPVSMPAKSADLAFVERRAFRKYGEGRAVCAGAGGTGRCGGAWKFREVPLLLTQFFIIRFWCIIFLHQISVDYEYGYYNSLSDKKPNP